jgi:hypothetical protein
MMVVVHSYSSVAAKARQANLSFKSARRLVICGAIQHAKYIQHRPGEDREKGGREVFTDAEDNADAKMLRDQIRSYEGNGVVIHKLTLSPEVRPKDPKEFTREVMKQLGEEKGLDLKWWAAAHRNTDHHHIHVIVMPKDRNGNLVRFDRDDYQRIKDAGDRYLERTQYDDYRAAHLVREEKARDRNRQRQDKLERDRQERIQNGEELPWLNRKIVREQLEPYEVWRKEKSERQKTKDKNPVDEKNSFEYQGKRYSKDDGYERLSGLKRYLFDNTDESLKLPKNDYKRLNQWIEQKERQRFSGELGRQLTASKERAAAQDAAKNMPSANRYVSPLQQDLMRNPVMGLFLSGASIAAEIVRAIPLTDQRDRLKESGDDLEDAKRDRESKQRRRKNPEDKASDEHVIRKIDEAIKDNKKSRDQRRKDRRKRKDNRDRDLDFTR